MHLEARFRLSIYLTLMLASACLGFTEEAFLPGILLFLIPVGILIALAYGVEGRWALSLLAANVVGMLIAVGWGYWLISQFINTPADFVKTAPFPAVFLPYIGPFLMVSMLAWLFCPKKTRDFWALHAVGFIEVTLACVLAAEFFFAVLLLAYLVCALWSLSLFHLYREEQGARADKGTDQRLSLALWPACRWVFVAFALALLLFLCTPQHGDSSWDPFRLAQIKPIETGYAQAIDLTQTGQLNLSNEVAFEVKVENADGTPKLDLSEATRWRGAVLEHYEKGVWFPGLAPFPVLHPHDMAMGQVQPPPRRRRRTRLTELPDLGAAQFFVTFQMNTRQLRGVFLAEPVIVQADSRPPVMSLDSEQDAWRFQANDWTLVQVHDPVLSLQGNWAYKQVTLPPDSDLSVPIVSRDPDRDFLQQPVRRIRSWTLALLRALRAQEKLGDDDFQAVTGTVLHQKREKVARALCQYLASARDFGYTLNLRRKDRSVDPIEDFLVNVKEGHCERYASALALMLRSCGIPARIVVGFRGAESETNDGRYIIRESCAHSWVEALVYHADDNGTLNEHWLSLDPTPSSDSSEGGKALWSGGWQGLMANGEMAWRGFIVDYNSERQLGAVQPVLILWRQLARWARSLPGGTFLWSATAVLSLIGMGLLLRRWRLSWPRRSKKKPCEIPCYDRFLALLERHLHLIPRPAQTPREFALGVAEVLRSQARTTPFAELPLLLAHMLYRVRYGQVPLQDSERHDVERRVRELGVCLAGSYKHS